MRRTLSALLAATLLAISATAVSADDVPMHRHILTLPSGKQVVIAKGICANRNQTAMNNLHRNVHLGPAGATWIERFDLVIELC